MITYKHDDIRYFYDPAVKSWTVYKLDTEGNQITEAEHYANKWQLKKNYPQFKFEREPLKITQ